jgi:hypothetical protein
MEIDESVKFAESIDFSRVARNDRIHMRQIVLKLLQFHKIMPKLDVVIFKTPDHYNVTVTGWNQHVSVKKLYEQFLSTTREQVMDYVEDISLIPTDEDGKGKLLLKVATSEGLILSDRKVKK